VAVVTAEIMHHLTISTVCKDQTFVPFFAVLRTDVERDVFGGVAEGHIIDVYCIRPREVVDNPFGGADAGVADAGYEPGNQWQGSPHDAVGISVLLVVGKLPLFRLN
jgi:hypothetical protein